MIWLIFILTILYRLIIVNLIIVIINNLLYIFILHLMLLLRRWVIIIIIIIIIIINTNLWIRRDYRCIFILHLLHLFLNFIFFPLLLYCNILFFVWRNSWKIIHYIISSLCILSLTHVSWPSSYILYNFFLDCYYN